MYCKFAESVYAKTKASVFGDEVEEKGDPQWVEGTPLKLRFISSGTHSCPICTAVSLAAIFE